MPRIVRLGWFFFSKTFMKISKFHEGVELMFECGLCLAKISKEIGGCSNYLSNYKRRNFEPGDAKIERLRRAIKKRAIYLLSFNPQEDSLAQLARKADMRLGKLSGRIGVSRQAINKGALSDEKLEKLVTEIHSIGKALLKLAQ